MSLKWCDHHTKQHICGSGYVKLAHQAPLLCEKPI